MHPNTAKKVLADEDTLDIGKTAEAVIEDRRLRDKKDKPKSKINSLRAHTAWLHRQQDKEVLRQKLKQIWNKHKKH